MLGKISVSPSPHISGRFSTQSVMFDVVIALAPAMVAACYFFRLHAALLIVTCVASCLATEYLCNFLRKRPSPHASLGDLSAVVTGVILALSLPPKFPAWGAVIGSAFSIAVGKMVFGGLGSNIFNPAMAGRAFLTASFGMLMTTWAVPATINPAMPVVSSENTEDARTQATPLAWSKQAAKEGKEARTLRQRYNDLREQLEEPGGSEEQLRPKIGETREELKQAEAKQQQYLSAVSTHLKATMLGDTAGCLGETSSLALLLGGLYLLIRKAISFHIPAAVLLSALACGIVNHLLNPGAINPLVHLTTGGLLICAFFIATDPVTAPLTIKGMWLFGVGVGFIIMLIRIVGEYPEGVMYAVLLMNAVTPLIDRLFKLTPAGGKPGV